MKISDVTDLKGEKMREIKFRAFLKNKKVVGKVNAIDFSLEKVRVSYYNVETENIITGTYDLSDVELMQYIGLKDKKRREVDEGDIVLVTYKNGECGKFRIGFMNGAFVAIDIKNNISHFNFDDYRIEEMIESIEVIGNIYENPELLEEY